MKRTIGTLLLAAILFAAPAGAQQPTTIVCEPAPGGRIICQQQPTATAKRVAIVAAVIVGVAVVVYLVHKHRKHSAPDRAENTQPQTPEKTPALDSK